MDSIRQWLLGKKNFAAGVALYETYGENDAVKNMLRSGYSAYRQSRLEVLLKEIADNAREVVVDVPGREEPVSISVAASVHDAPEDAVPADKDPFRSEWMEPYSQMKYLQHNLANAPDVAARCEMAHEILRLERACMRIWDKRAIYQATGKMPEEEVEEAFPHIEVNALQRTLGNYRANLSKAKKKFSANPLDHAAKARMEKYAAEIEKIERRLKDA